MLITSYETPGFWRRSTARRAVVLRRIAQAILPDYLTRMPFGGKRRKASGGDRTDRRRGKGRADEGSSRRRRGFALLHALRRLLLAAVFRHPPSPFYFRFPCSKIPGPACWDLLLLLLLVVPPPLSAGGTCTLRRHPFPRQADVCSQHIIIRLASYTYTPRAARPGPAIWFAASRTAVPVLGQRRGVHFSNST